MIEFRTGSVKVLDILVDASNKYEEYLNTAINTEKDMKVRHNLLWRLSKCIKIRDRLETCLYQNSLREV